MLKIWDRDLFNFNCSFLASHDMNRPDVALNRASRIFPTQGEAKDCVYVANLGVAATHSKEKEKTLKIRRKQVDLDF